MVDREMLKILFVCSMNRWRSPTAEKIYADHPQVHARSCGTNKKARRPVSADDLQWADIVMVMEQKHKRRLLTEHPGEMRFTKTYVLDVPDQYKFMEIELINEIRCVADPILANNLT